MRLTLALLGTALAAVSLPSQADSSVKFVYGSFVTGPSTITTIAGPYGQNSYSASFPSSATNLAQATLGPAPAVSTLLTGITTDDPEIVSALQYQVLVKAGESSIVHVDFLADFFDSGVGYGNVNNGVYFSQAVTQLSLQSNLGSWSAFGTFQSGYFGDAYNVNTNGCLTGTYFDAGTFVRIDSSGGNAYQGSSATGGCITTHSGAALQGGMSGSVALRTDSNGYATLNVTLATESIAYETTGISSVIAILDPSFALSATDLSTNPAATLAVLDGVGNLVGAVPEPPAAWLFLGLPAVLMRSRRR